MFVIDNGRFCCYNKKSIITKHFWKTLNMKYKRTKWKTKFI